MHLVEIGRRPGALGDIAQLTDRRDVAIYRLDRLEAHKLRLSYGTPIAPPVLLHGDGRAKAPIGYRSGRSRSSGPLVSEKFDVFKT